MIKGSQNLLAQIDEKIGHLMKARAVVQKHASAFDFSETPSISTVNFPPDIYLQSVGENAKEIARQLGGDWLLAIKEGGRRDYEGKVEDMEVTIFDAEKSERTTVEL